MKIITLHQPWASLVAQGLKRYETRHWSTDYCGPLLIHAAKQRATDAQVEGIYDSLRKLGSSTKEVAQLDQVLGEFLMWKNSLPYGEIVAIADLTKCLEMMNGWVETDIPPGFTLIQSKSALEQAVGLWEPGRFAFRLDNVRPLTSPIPFTSRQGKLLDAPAEIIALVNEQLKEVA